MASADSYLAGGGSRKVSWARVAAGGGLQAGRLESARQSRETARPPAEAVALVDDERLVAGCDHLPRRPTPSHGATQAAGL